MKSLTSIPLTAMCMNTTSTHLEVATPQTFDNVVTFTGILDNYVLNVTPGESLEICANNILIARLAKHSTQNYYHGVSAKGNKIQVSLKKLVGSLRVWS